ncbi:MAG: oligosaccharide flippase family protein, partial [Bacteroidota bacterium]
MQRKFFSNLILLLLLNLLVKPAWVLGIDRSFQNHLGFANYGDYANIFSFSLILSVILDLGINNFVSSAIAKQPERINELYLPLLFVKIFFGLIY